MPRNSGFAVVPLSLLAIATLATPLFAKGSPPKKPPTTKAPPAAKPPP